MADLVAAAVGVDLARAVDVAAAAIWVNAGVGDLAAVSLRVCVRVGETLDRLILARAATSAEDRCE
jgi:hypothetical protein